MFRHAQDIYFFCIHIDVEANMALMIDPVFASIIGKAIGFIFFGGVIVACLVIFLIWRLVGR
ncbi:MAG: hypothetical protein NVS2B16_04500 [Chloroflexota bacterium]